MFRPTCLLLAICTMAYGFQQQDNPRDIERDKDVYAIYSLMLTNPSTSYSADHNEYYLISATTGPGNPRKPCIRPPKEREADFQQVLADYQSPKPPRQLQRSLTIPKSYVLASAADVKEFIDDRAMPGPNHQPNPRFRGIADLFTLSDVYFNQNRTLALTFISSWCGGLCALYQWKVFEKPSGQWEELHWNACVVIAKDTLPPSHVTVWRTSLGLGRPPTTIRFPPPQPSSTAARCCTASDPLAYPESREYVSA